VDVPDVSYARSGDVAIAYQVSGGGEFDVVFAAGYVTHLTHLVEHPPIAAFFDRLSSFGRLIRFDRRGVGLSDRPRDVPTLEARMDDIRAVMDAAGSPRAALIATGEAGAMAILFAATYPERTGGLILWNPFARAVEAPDYPIGETEAEWLRQLAEIDANWGRTDFFAKRFSEDWPDLRDDEAALRWYCETLRCGASPGAALTVHRMAMDVDVRDVLAAIRVPVLILHRAAVEGSPEDARYMAERIPGAKCVAIPGRGQPWQRCSCWRRARRQTMTPPVFQRLRPHESEPLVPPSRRTSSRRPCAPAGARRPVSGSSAGTTRRIGCSRIHPAGFRDTLPPAASPILPAHG